MGKIIIKGVAGADGSYDLDLDTLTMGEARLIKREAGVRFGEIGEALEAGDSDILVAFALIALKRASLDIPPDALWEAEIGGITVDFSNDVEEVADLPPDHAPVSAASGNGNTESGSSSSSDAGEVSPETLIPPLTGNPT